MPLKAIRGQWVQVPGGKRKNHQYLNQALLVKVKGAKVHLTTGRPRDSQLSSADSAKLHFNNQTLLSHNSEFCFLSALQDSNAFKSSNNSSRRLPGVVDTRPPEPHL